MTPYSSHTLKLKLLGLTPDVASVIVPETDTLTLRLAVVTGGVVSVAAKAIFAMKAS
jgi:hypothetical protein